MIRKLGFLISHNLMYFSTQYFLLSKVVALFLSSFFLEKNEAKKSSLFSNRFAFKVVHSDTVFNIARLSPNPYF